MGVLIPPIEENTDKVRTSQRAGRQVERRDVAELADRARQREARVVVLELDVAAVDLHADERERQLTWRKRASVARPGVLQHPFTSQIVHAQVNLGHTVAQLADVRRELEAAVALQLDSAPFDKLPSQQHHRNRACSRKRWDLRLGRGCSDSSSEFLKAMCARTFEGIVR